MAFVAIYDACVLYPAPIRDFLFRLTQAGIVRARWTDMILDEVIRGILRNRSDLDEGKLARTRQLMTEVAPDCMVVGYAELIPSLRLPDPDDRHVLAAAIRAHAQAIVTSNLKDFPADLLAPFDLEARHPDDFVVDQIDLAPGRVIQVLVEQAAALRHPPKDVDEILATLARCGLPQSVAKLRALRGNV